jgi:RNA polymerase sigma-70 factor (ECF subfamily)
LKSIQLILKKCLKKDRISQQWIYENFYAYALKIAFRYSDSYQDAANVVNDSFVKMYTSLHQFNLNDTEQATEARFKGWLVRIVINKGIDHYRSNSNKIVFQNFEDDVYEIVDESSNAETLLMYKEMIQYLKELPINYQLVFNMHVIDGYTHAEIATILNMNEGTSKSNLYRAKQMLQEKLSVFLSK